MTLMRSMTINRAGSNVAGGRREALANAAVLGDSRLGGEILTAKPRHPRCRCARGPGAFRRTGAAMSRISTASKAFAPWQVCKACHEPANRLNETPRLGGPGRLTLAAVARAEPPRLRRLDAANRIGSLIFSGDCPATRRQRPAPRAKSKSCTDSWKSFSKNAATRTTRCAGRAKVASLPHGRKRISTRGASGPHAATRSR